MLQVDKNETKLIEELKWSPIYLLKQNGSESDKNLKLLG
jgi:hypothetical protein